MHEFALPRRRGNTKIDRSFIIHFTQTLKRTLLIMRSPELVNYEDNEAQRKLHSLLCNAQKTVQYGVF